jgi:hypothetical protein
VGSNRTGGMDVCCECSVLSGRGLCDGLIARPEESYRLRRVVVCDQETSNEEAKARYWAVKIQPKRVITAGKQTNNSILSWKKFLTAPSVDLTREMYRAVKEYVRANNITRTEDARNLGFTAHQAMACSSISLREDQDLPTSSLRFSRATEATVQ